MVRGALIAHGSATSCRHAGRRLGLFTHRDLTLDWNTRRTRVGRARHSVNFLQNTILDEFGHTLGLDHVGGQDNSNANYGVTLVQRQDVMGMGDRASARAAQPCKSQLRQHQTPARGNRDDAALRFAARVVSPQLITYWDNDWVLPEAPAAPAAP